MKRYFYRFIRLPQTSHPRTVAGCRTLKLRQRQLGKNFSDGNNLLISGKDLLGMAMQKVFEAKKLSGGKVVYVECENKENLLKFYKENDFEVFGKRDLDRDETDVEGSSLMQLFRYME